MSLDVILHNFPFSETLDYAEEKPLSYCPKTLSSFVDSTMSFDTMFFGIQLQAVRENMPLLRSQYVRIY
jgi:hypothetical protein